MLASSDVLDAAHPQPRRPWHDTQGLVLSAYPEFDQAAYVLFRIVDANLTKKWLSDHLPLVTTADKHAAPHRTAKGLSRNLNIAFTATGFNALRFGSDYFSEPFRNGMHHSLHRSRVLGDIGESAPEKWEWGGPTKPVDVLLMVFVTKDDNLDVELEALRPPATAMTKVRCIKACRLSDMKQREHFGFTDGISQPILEGTLDAERFPDSIHLTARGEVVLGYPNAFGITLGVSDRVGRIDPLPKLQRLPTVDDVDTFGLNGSYLVLRQLAQDVEAFRRYVAAQTKSANHEAPAAQQLAAKMIGRWRDGTPLVPYATVDDNEFVYAEDPYGGGCPIGAHVRRANPRDALLNTGRPFRPTNEHRIVRRGRSYGPAPNLPSKEERGLLFLCLNADIERQFEFIQQNWINNPAFAGLANERDPLVGAGEGAGGGSFTLGGLPARQCVRELPRFVTVRGGQYFFLPGINALDSLTVPV